MFPIWIEKAEDLYNKNYSFTKIGEILKVNRKLISYYLQLKGYEPNHKYMPKTKVIQKTQKNVNHNIFNNLDSEEKAYWLGMLMADGAIGSSRPTIELCLKEEDYEHIVKFKTFLESEHKIGVKTKYCKKTNKVYKSYRLGIRSESIKKDLIKYGCIPNKTKILEFPNIEPTLINHFIRGYLDGDGCIRKGSTSDATIEILGTNSFLEGITKHFEIDGHIYNFNHSDIKRFVVSGKKAKEILNLLYKDANIYLDRKYKKYLDICRPISNSLKE